MKYIRYMLLCFLALLTLGFAVSCAAVEKVKKTFTPTPDPAEVDFVRRVLNDMAAPIIALFLCLGFCSCKVRPTIAFNPDGSMKVASAGASFLTKSKAERVKMRMPGGYEIDYMSVGDDETGVPGALIGSKTTLGLADNLVKGLKTTEGTKRHLDDNVTTRFSRSQDSVDLTTTTNGALEQAKIPAKE